jgi:hypothetical protein
VERLWCQDHNIPWTLVDTSAFNKTLLKNLRFLRSWYRQRHEPDLEESAEFAEVFKRMYRRNVLLKELILQTARTLKADAASAQDIFRHCGWSDLIQVSWKHPLALNEPLVMRPGSSN